MKMRTRNKFAPLVAIVLTILLCLPILFRPSPVRASTTTLTGTIVDAQGSPVNGTLVLQLAVPAQDPTTNVQVSTRPVSCSLINGIISNCPPIFDSMVLNPSPDYYTVTAYDTAGTPVLYGNYVITGASFNLGTAIPTSITTNNIYYGTPVLVSANNTFTGTNTFTQQIVSSLSTGTPPFSISSTTLVPNLNINNLNGVIVSGTPAAGYGLVATGPSAATWSASTLSGYTAECNISVPATVANTTTPTSLQTCPIAANEWIPNRSIYLDITGQLSDAGAPTLTIKILMDATIIQQITPTLAGGINQNWSFRGVLSCQSAGVSGSVTAFFGQWIATASAGGIFEVVPPYSVTLNTTTSHTFAVQVTWGFASVSNTITQYSTSIYRVGA